MRLEITRVEGIRNDLLLRLDRAEVDHALLSVAHRDRLIALPGIPRHRDATKAETQAQADSKISLERHLERLGIVDPSGTATRRAVAISNRNLGTNHGHLAWQHVCDRLRAEGSRQRRAAGRQRVVQRRVTADHRGVTWQSWA